MRLMTLRAGRNRRLQTAPSSMPMATRDLQAVLSVIREADYAIYQRKNARRIIRPALSLIATSKAVIVVRRMLTEAIR